MSSDNQEMPFIQHLAELRDCLIRITIALLTTSVLSIFFADHLFQIIVSPLYTHFEGSNIIGTGPAEPFIIRLKLAIGAGFILSLPVSFREIWKFIEPALHQHEKKFALPFIFLASLFFILGILFCFNIIFPYAFNFFAEEFISFKISPEIRVAEYFSFAFKLLMIFGLIFELPLVAFFFAKLGLISHRWLIQHFAHFILGIFVFSAIITPPDVITQLLLALPLITIYLFCIAIAYFFRKKSNE